LEEKIKEDKGSKKKDCGQLRKQKNTSMSSLEHLVEKNERQDGESLKAWLKWT
jgi:hypothetical protein